MRLEKIISVLVVFCVSFGAYAQSGLKYFLVDQRTQMPVMTCTVPQNWLVAGKVNWTSEPATPVHWYAWTMSPDQNSKMIVSSLAVLPAMGQIRQVPFLQNPMILANRFMQNIQNDYQLAGIRVADARFIQHEPDQALINSRIQMAQANGIRPTNFYFTELFVKYEGMRNGRNCIAVMSLPMLATENRPTMMSFATVVELLFPMSFSCPPEMEAATKAKLESMVKSMQMNPHFTQFVNQIAKQRTVKWLQMQNEIRNQQFELADSTSKTNERVRDMWSDYIRDVDRVSNPNSGEKMFVDSHYDHAWINSNDEVIYHNNGFNTPNASTATFDPNSNALFNSQNWRQLK